MSDMVVDRSSPAYVYLRGKVLEAEGVPTMKLHALVHMLSTAPDIDWEAIRRYEKMFVKSWAAISANWKQKVIQALSTPGRFTSGGDQTSATVRGAKQLAIVQYVRSRALAAPAMEDDDVVADRCVDDVTKQWRTSNMDTLWAVVRVVTKQERRRAFRGDEDGGTGDNSALFESFEKETIVETTTHEVATGDRNFFTGLQRFTGMDTNARDRMLELQRQEVARMRSDPEYVRAESVRLQAETARAERNAEFVKAETMRLQADTVRLQSDAARAEQDPDYVKAESMRLQAETARLQAETACLEAQSKLRAGPCPEDAVNTSTTPPAASRKRPRPVRSLEERVLAASSYPHQSMKPLSMHVWEGRPAHYAEDIRAVYTLVSKWVGSHPDVHYINRPLPKIAPCTVATYVHVHTDVDFLVQAFWNRHTPPMPHNAEPQQRPTPRRRETPGVPRTLLCDGEEMVSVSHDILDSLNNLMPQVKWLFDVIVKWFMERIMPPAAPDAPDVLIQHTGGLSVVFTWPATNPKHLSASHRRDLLESIVQAILRR